MRTAVDSNILIDIFLPDPKFGEASREALKIQFSKGALIIGEIVYSELAAFFETQKDLDDALRTLDIQLIPAHRDVCYKAGQSWKKYRKSGGDRQRVLADFLIASHSQAFADALLTRDRGFYRKYFSDLLIIEP